MICTMTHDRIKYNTINAELKILKDQYSLLETQIVAKNKEIELLKEALQTKEKTSMLQVKLDNLTKSSIQKS